MIPRKSNTLYPKIAQELDMPEELVSDVINFYWKTIKKELDEPTDINIQLDFFGSFQIRKKQVLYQIDKLEKIVKRTKLSTYNRYAIVHAAAIKLDRMRNLLTLIEQEEEKKKKIRKTQKNG